ncbi:MAG: substrate-binding domain-containing protein [Yokenella regensburgei]|jgi:tungstate transport system substrate-binding protein|uniref:substrate-binding domain-containing protein n=1 Tax=Yokenella regensburgei TaxID=158877 RepID=UPI002847E6AF|nr:substrate-binding domain-containing protein [Yokenella regensburgei]
MLNHRKHLCGALLLTSLLIPSFASARQTSPAPIRVAVIGGMMYSNLWQTLSARFEQQHPEYRIEVVAKGQRPKLAKAMEEGKVDLLTMHSGDITTDLVANGHGIHMRPWTRNDLVIWGPREDPAGIRGMKDGAQALAKIAASRSPWVDFQGVGPREMAHSMWARAGVRPVGDWVLKDDLPGGRGILSQVADRHAYIITGRMPVLLGKWTPDPRIEILVDGDPTMRRPYIVMETNPHRHPGVNSAGARALADFLLSPDTQRFLLSYDGSVKDGRPLFYPVWPQCKSRQTAWCH